MSASSVLLEEAEESISTGQWDLAIEKLEELRRSEQWSIEFYPKLVRINAVRGRFLTVLSVYLEWAETALSSGDFEQAEAALGYARALRPDSTEVQEVAVKVARQRVSPEKLADRLVELAHLHLEKGDGDRAVALVEEAIQARPEDDSLKLQLGETYVANGQIASGLKVFEQFVEQHSDCGDPTKLLEPLQRINLLKPDSTETVLHLGRVYLALDEVDKAEEQFRAVLRLDLENQDALLELARVCQKKGLFRNGLLALNRVVQQSPELPRARRQMAELHLAAGCPEKAVHEFLEAARLYTEAEETSVTIELYRTVLRVDTENSQALNALRGLSLQAGEDLTANLFPPIEEAVETPDKEPRAELVESEKAEGFEAVELIEKKPAEPRAGLMPKRPALTPKSQQVGKGPRKPTLLTSGERKKGSRLRDGLISRSETEKPVMGESRPYFPREEVAVKEEVTVQPEGIEEFATTPPQEVAEIEPEPVAEVVSPALDEELVLDKVPEQDDEFDILFTNPEEIFDPEEPFLPNEGDLDIPAYDEVFDNEQSGNDKLVELDVVEEPEPVALAPVEVESEEKTEDQEPNELFTAGAVAAEVLFPPDDDIFEGFEALEKESIFKADSDWMQSSEDDSPLFPVMEEPLLEPEQETITEEPGSSLPENFDWLFKVEEVDEDEDDAGRDPIEAIPALDETLLEPEVELEPAADPEPEVEPEPEKAEVDFWEPLSVTEHEAEEPMPTFEWELDFNIAEEPEPSPLFPEPDDEPAEEPNEEPVELDFETLRKAEISRLATDDELTTESPELIRLLEDTLPQTAPSEEFQPAPEAEEEALELFEPEPAAETELVSEFVPDAGDELEEDCDAATLIENYRNRLEASPTDEKALQALADACLRYGLLREALQHYRKIQKANPFCSTTSARIIKTALWMEDIETAKTELWKAAGLSFDTGDLKTCQDRLGDLLSLDRDHKQARQLMVEVFLAGGQDKLAAWHLGQMVERAVAEREYDLAIDSLRRLNEVSPSDAALERLGELYQKQHRLGEALEIFRGLRGSHAETGRAEDALRLARLVVELEPNRTKDREVLIRLLGGSDSPETITDQQLELARLYRQQDEVDKAIELLQSILRENPEHLDAERLLVELHLQNRSIDLAEQHAESLAERFLEQKAYQKAIELFEYWVGAAPASARARERLAQFYQLNGDLEGAKMEWMMVTESHHAAGDFQRAARSLERALELEPGQTEWRLSLARLKVEKLALVDSALHDYRQLFKADPSWRKATVCYLDLLMDESRMAEMGEVLQEVERLNPDSDLKHNVVQRIKQKMAAEPDNLPLAFGWGELCLALGMLDLAIEQFQRLRRHEKYQLHSYRLLGLCFSRKKGFNMVELAVSQFKRGLALEGQTEEDRLALRYDMASVLETHDRIPEALEQLKLIAEENLGYRDVSERLDRLSTGQ